MLSRAYGVEEVKSLAATEALVFVGEIGVDNIILEGDSSNVIKGSFGWRSGKVGRLKISKRMEKWEDRKYLIFLRVYLGGGMEK